MTRTQKRRLASLVAVAASVAAVLSFPLNSGAASVTAIPFTAIRYGCSATDGEAFVTADKILHVRNAINHNLWVASTPYLTGYADNVVNADIDLATGVGNAHPHQTMKPFAYEGTWEAQVQIKIRPDGNESDGVGHGTGVLTGMTVRWQVTGNFVTDSNPCGNNPFAATLAGEIQIPASAA